MFEFVGNHPLLTGAGIMVLFAFAGAFELLALDLKGAAIVTWIWGGLGVMAAFLGPADRGGLESGLFVLALVTYLTVVVVSWRRYSRRVSTSTTPQRQASD